MAIRSPLYVTVIAHTHTNFHCTTHSINIDDEVTTSTPNKAELHNATTHVQRLLLQLKSSQIHLAPCMRQLHPVAENASA